MITGFHKVRLLSVLLELNTLLLFLLVPIQSQFHESIVAIQVFLMKKYDQKKENTYERVTRKRESLFSIDLLTRNLVRQ
jgi:hypothetical protein